VLADEREAVAAADCVVGAWDVCLDVAEFAATDSMLLGAGVHSVDRVVRCIRDQRDLLWAQRLG